MLSTDVSLTHLTSGTTWLIVSEGIKPRFFARLFCLNSWTRVEFLRRAASVTGCLRRIKKPKGQGPSERAADPCSFFLSTSLRIFRSRRCRAKWCHTNYRSSACRHYGRAGSIHCAHRVAARAYMRNYIIHLRPRARGTQAASLAHSIFTFAAHIRRRCYRTNGPRGEKGSAARFSFIQLHARKSEWLLSNYRARRAADLQFIIGVASFVGGAAGRRVRRLENANALSRGFSLADAAFFLFAAVH